MSRLDRTLIAVVAGTLLAAAGCGDSGGASDPADAGTSPAHAGGAWLLRFGTAGGADGERSGSVYVSYDPQTGQASARRLPGVVAADASEDEQVLLVSADHRWAIPDTRVPRTQRTTGKLVLASVTDDRTETLDMRAATGDRALTPVAWAFDATDGDVLRVVDDHRGVWKVDLAARSATKERVLPTRSGWIFGDGFDKTTGEPYIESIDSDETEPAGNGDDDTRPVERQGGTLLRYDGEDVAGLPTAPCGFAGGFRDDDGAWLFCADTPSISAYRLSADGKTWQAYGTPSPRIVPGAAVEMTFALPPTD
jgi:hypothetical protein